MIKTTVFVLVLLLLVASIHGESVNHNNCVKKGNTYLLRDVSGPNRPSSARPESASCASGKDSTIFGWNGYFGVENTENRKQTYARTFFNHATEKFDNLDLNITHIPTKQEVGTFYHSGVAALGDGNFVQFYALDLKGELTMDWFGQIVKPDGTVLKQFNMTAYYTRHQENLKVERFDNDHFIVMWLTKYTHWGGANSDFTSNIRLAIFKNDGTIVKEEFSVVNTSTSQCYPYFSSMSVCGKDGETKRVSTSFSPCHGSDEDDIAFRSFDVTKAGDSFKITEKFAGYKILNELRRKKQRWAIQSPIDDGSCEAVVVVWTETNTSRLDIYGSGIVGQIVNSATGEKIGSNLLVNEEQTIGNQQFPYVRCLGARCLVAWHDAGITGKIFMKGYEYTTSTSVFANVTNALELTQPAERFSSPPCFINETTVILPWDTKGAALSATTPTHSPAATVATMFCEDSNTSAGSPVVAARLFIYAMMLVVTLF